MSAARKFLRAVPLGRQIKFPSVFLFLTRPLTINRCLTLPAPVSSNEERLGKSSQYFKVLHIRYLRHSSDLLKVALLQYKELNSNMLVPYKFVIPRGSEIWPEKTWGMRLGVMVDGIRAGRGYAYMRDELISMGFDYSPKIRGHGEDSVMQALLLYKELHGDMLVPSKFVIPQNNKIWPEKTWGMKLGKTVINIRLGRGYVGMRSELLTLGFDFRPQTKAYGQQSVKQALLRYKKLHGDMLVPQRFVIPDESDVWPENIWSMKLGATVSGIRRGLCYEYMRSELLEIGFDYSPQVRGYGEQSVKQALVQYKELYGHVMVPRRFVIPDKSDAWPEKTWGMKLGRTVENIQLGRAYAFMRDELLSIGLDFSDQNRETAQQCFVQPGMS